MNKNVLETVATSISLVSAHSGKDLLVVCEELLKNEELERHLNLATEGLKFSLSALGNFEPFSSEVPAGLDPTFYQTCSYLGDIKLRDKYLKYQAVLENETVKKFINRGEK